VTTTIPRGSGGTNPVDNPDDDVASPNVARIVGADTIEEYRTDIDPLGAKRESYRIQLDEPADVGTVFVVDTRDIEANRTSNPAAPTQYIGYGQAATVRGARFIDSDPWDYTVTKDGNVVTGPVTLFVPAGSTVSSDSFEIDAWAEFTWYGPFLELFEVAFEDLERFNLDIVRVENTGQDYTLIDRDIRIFDNGRFYVYDTSPIALDLNGDGEIGVTGEHTAKGAARTAMGATVEFDLDADGTLDTVEWFAGDGDGILVDTTKIGPNGEIDGSALFGDQGGVYANGYEKLALLDADGDGAVSGGEAGDLALWVDDGDAVLEAGELTSLADAGVVSIDASMELDNEGRMRSTASMADGSTIMTEDVWFLGH
jgi:hypothetical protein